MTKKLISIILVSFLLHGCATPFSEYYYDQLGVNDITKLPFVVLPTEEPQVYRGNNQEQDSLKMYEDNFTLVGYSSFNAGNVDEKDAINQARKVHASVVIVYSKYTGTVSGVTPLTLPTTNTSLTTLNGNSYGSNGNTTYSGTASTTTQGTQTTYIPYSVDRSDFLATYWVKMKPETRFGVNIRDLTPKIRQQLGSNKGVLVYAVIKGSPAFKADIFNGDILKQIGDDFVYDIDSSQKAVEKYEGKDVDILIVRGDKEIHKLVKFGKVPW